jgi:aminopeptidase
MGEDHLTGDELSALIQRVFQPRRDDRGLAILIDLPDEQLVDNPEWRARRALAAGWARELSAAHDRHGLDVSLICYRNVKSNNADLPTVGWRVDPDEVPGHINDTEPHRTVELEHVLAGNQLLLAPTELSTTAPLKMLAPRFGFRAATMPGFSNAMVPALRLDYTEIDRRVRVLKERLDRSRGADIRFVVDGHQGLQLHLDLRHRTAHASGGLFPEPGVAGNLPSGESYIVPYEGEIEGDPTTTNGRLPIQLGDEVVLFEINDNRVAGVVSAGPASDREAARVAAEPAAGNVAELGLGVLADFGIEPIGEVLLDEKLGLHIALGRSEHFGGQIGPRQFSRPEAVIHQDHVYLPQLQPRVAVATVVLEYADGSSEQLMRNGLYTIDFAV